MLADNLKKAEKAAAGITAKNIELGTNNAAVTRRIARHHASTVRKPTTAIEQPRSDGVGLAPNQGPLTVQPVQVLEHTKALSKVTSMKAESAASTTSAPQLYDIVTIAQMVIAKLASRNRKATRNTIRAKVQPYAPISINLIEPYNLT